MRTRSLHAFLALAGLFLAALVACNLIVQKFFAFPWPDWVPLVGGSMAVLSVGILPYPLTFLVTDLISEIYGRKRANAVVWTGLLASVFVVATIQLANLVPAMTGRGWTGPWVQDAAPASSNSEVRAAPWLHWTGRTEILVTPKGARSPELVLLLEAPPGGIEVRSGTKLAALLDDAKGVWPHAADWDFVWEQEWAGDLEGTTGRGRLRLEDVTAHPHVFWAPHGSRDYGSPPEELVLSVVGDGPLGRLLPTGENHELPKSPVTDSVFHHVFGGTWRAILASMIAYLVAQYLDIQIFHFWKRLTRGRFLWLRNNFSTITSQFLDSALVVSVLFYDVWENEAIVQAALSAWVFKMLVALSDTPFLYLGVWLFTRFDLAPEDSEYARRTAERRMARVGRAAGAG